jgi:hypothetical protein
LFGKDFLKSSFFCSGPEYVVEIIDFLANVGRGVHITRSRHESKLMIESSTMNISKPVVTRKRGRLRLPCSWNLEV